MSIDSVKEYIRKHDPQLVPIEFSEKTATVEEAARALGVEPAMIAKTILFRAGDNYALFVTAGDVRANTKKVKALLGSKPKLASAEEVKEVTGHPIGGVCPFAIKKYVPVYLDESMKRFEVVYIAAGTPHSALPITFDQLCAITSGSVVDVLPA